MSKRKYTKKSDYWKKFEQNAPVPSFMESQAAWTPELAGEGFYESVASRGAAARNTTTRRRNVATNSDKGATYDNIGKGMLPYSYSKGGIHIQESIELCQKAYANVSIFRNAIDIMAEFSNAELVLEGGTAVSKNFIETWFKKINMWALKDQFFREYYRSGNVFLYTIQGKFKLGDFKNFSKKLSVISKNELPLKYIIINPYDIVRKHSSSFSTSLYQKILSEYELERLKNPKTDSDREIYKALSPEAKDKIQRGGYVRDGIKVDLDPKYLRYCFYKKQDYEPFAIPFGFPVLDDINFKLELKKIDQAITRTIENVILLITMGAEPDKGGVNPKNLVAMQSLFQNESVGRVLVSDYTTKAQFVIPEINKVLGPEKYEIVNQDIKEGLQNIIVGQEKFSNTAVKAEIFLERLKESRNAFLHQFLQPEIDQLCKNLGMKKAPVARFEEVNVKDETQLQRVTTRLMEIGVLTPQQGIDVIKTGIFPDSELIEPAQEAFVEEREKGYYNPLVGGVPMMTGAEQPNNNSTPKSAGRPVGTSGIPKEASAKKDLYSVDYIQDVVKETDAFRQTTMAKLKKENQIKRFTKKHKDLLDRLCESVITSSELGTWSKNADRLIKNPKSIISLETITEINNISVEHQLDTYSAALLYHSKKFNKK